MTHQHDTPAGIMEVIPGSRIIQFYGNADFARATLREYGDLITSFSDDGPHVLRVNSALDFATIVQTVETQLALLAPRERAAGT